MENTPDIREMFEIDGRSYESFKFLPPDKIVAWEKSAKVTGANWTGMSGGQLDISRVLNLEDIEFEVLKNMKIFSVLSDDVKAKLEKHIHIVRDEVSDRMEKARAARKDRKSKYENIPEEIACSKCSKMVEAVPSYIAAYCNRKEILLADYLKDFKCKQCKSLEKPARAEKVKLTCKCGFEVIYPVNIVQKYADKKGLTKEAFIASYVCKKCNPSHFGRVAKVKEVTDTTTTLPKEVTSSTTTRGRKPKEEFKGLPKRMACIVCGKEVASNLDYLKGKAEKLGTTIEALIKGYKCGICKKL